MFMPLPAAWPGERMRILHVYKDYYPVLGGIENHIRALAEAQTLRGHAVTVLAASRDRHSHTADVNGVRVVFVPRLATAASMPLSPGFPQALRRLPADLTHLHAPFPLGEVSQWLSGRRPYVVTYHADVTRPVQVLIMRLYGPLYRRILRGAARLLPTSAAYAATSPYLRELGDRCTVVPLGIDPAGFRPAPEAPAGPLTLLFVGLLRHYKGVDVVLQALTEVPEVRLRLAGEGPLRQEWEAQARALGLSGRVEFLGRVPDADLPDLYRSAHAFVLPATSRAEAFGTVLLEAMASGLPCLTTEVGSGTSFVVQHEVTGLVVSPRNPSALAAAIRRLAAEPETRRRMGAAGRERVQSNFTLPLMTERVERVYAQALA
jgi:rhamnosyl/mannosyltransferase